MGYVRSGAKDHGRKNQIEGKLLPGQKVVVIEDLISTGGSVLEVVDGQLVETTADGQHRLIRQAKPKHKVTLGSVIKVRRCS